MKKWTLLLLVFVLVGQGCVNAPMDENGDEAMTEEDSMMMEDERDENMEDDAMMEEGEDKNSEDDDMMMQDEDEDGAMQVSMKSGNFFFEPATLAAAPGQTITVTFSENDGTHTFVIDEIDFKETVVEGGSITFTAPEEPGSYAYYCDIGSHRALGMEGVLVVK